MENTSLTFINNLRSLREANGYNQKIVAQKIDVAQTTYSAYEKGTHMPSCEIIDRIAAFYEIPAYQLFIEQEKIDRMAIIGENLTNCSIDYFLAMFNEYLAFLAHKELYQLSLTFHDNVYKEKVCREYEKHLKQLIEESE